MKRSERSGAIQESAGEAVADGDGRLRRRWERPTVVVLPRMAELTLQTTVPGACDCPGGGGVIP